MSRIEIETFLQITEVKRIYSALETTLLKTSPACIVVTSARPGEGKTITTAGLACTTAHYNKKRILAMDLNWYAPSLHTYFGVNLIDARSIKSEITVSEHVQKSGIDHLDIFPAVVSSQEGPSAAFDGHLISAELVTQAINNYDIVFIDTSAMFPVNRNMLDPVVIAKKADGVVLVILVGETSRQQVKAAKVALETAGAKISGVIVNQWRNPLA
jgi:Mrp family chromosome partitioning ATPase